MVPNPVFPRRGIPHALIVLSQDDFKGSVLIDLIF